MNKILIKIKTNLIDKNRIKEVSFTNSHNEEVKYKEMSLEVIPLKEKTVKASGDTWKLLKVGFVTEVPTKEEKEAKTKLPIIGEALQFENTIQQPNFDKDSKGVQMGGKSETITPDDVPF